ncbi:hypothetical protein V6N13_084002 [Hibiscus sabdariffa]
MSGKQEKLGIARGNLGIAQELGMKKGEIDLEERGGDIKWNDSVSREQKVMTRSDVGPMQMKENSPQRKGHQAEMHQPREKNDSCNK